MMKKLFILACVCLLITSCNSNSKNTNDSATSTETTDMHNAENSLDYDGTYTGTFPAADCPAIHPLDHANCRLYPPQIPSTSRSSPAR